VREPARRNRLEELIGNGTVKVTSVGSAEAAIRVLRDRRHDCLVFEPGLPDFPAALADALVRAPELSEMPMIAYSEKDFDPKEEVGLKQLSQNVNLRQAHSAERLLDQAMLCLHSAVSGLPEAR